MPTTEEIVNAIRDRLSTGESLEPSLDQLTQIIEELAQKIASPDQADSSWAREEASQLQQQLAELTELGEARLDSLRTEVVTVVRKGSLHRLYGLTVP